MTNPQSAGPNPQSVYSAAIQEHLARPRNSGALANADATAECVNPVCGDHLQLFLRLRGKRITAAGFLAYGCPPTIACGSVLTEMLQGLTTDEAQRLTRREIIDALGGLPPRKNHAAALAVETLHAALAKI